ncbi:MAG: anti-sigma F factor antagonist [Alteromonadaceae bacterium]|uniref:STAS domain-containing protein n=1 Tax=unclassified Marinobacter TaxID=83889 RepID=UPI000C36A5ED|nr:anti-sigma F factor antagonist [Alteromonadaceae bacterium]MBH86148.1 anti-sigma F factor antagonist [Alteromonadaceae bacterium]MDG5499527.1 STAS domain-containing protein [Marinobacter sp. BGYM27]
MPLTIDIQSPGPTAIKVSLTGSLDSQTTPELEAALNQAMTDQTQSVAFDMGGVDFISSAGLRVIFKTLKRVKKHGGKVSVSRMSEGVRKVFEIVKVLPDLEVFASEEEMDEYLAAIQNATR